MYLNSWYFWLFPYRRLHFGALFSTKNLLQIHYHCLITCKGQQMFGFMIFAAHHAFLLRKTYHTLRYLVCDTPAGCTCFPQQWPSDVHGGLLWLPPGRAGACAYWSATDQKGKAKYKIPSPGRVWIFLVCTEAVKSSSDPCWTFDPSTIEGDARCCFDLDIYS